MMEQPYHPLDRELWRELRRAVGDVPMSITAHQNIQRLFEQAEQQARMKALTARQTKTGTEGDAS